MQPFNPPAFPGLENTLHRTPVYHEGMTLRDYFASQALIGVLSFGTGKPLDIVTSAAFEIADAMIAERMKGKD